MGGILARREQPEDQQQVIQYDIPLIDLVIVDLYPFEQTVGSGASEEEIIEKIDIGGISLIRAAAKNFKDILIVPSMEHYSHLTQLLKDKKGYSEIKDRLQFAKYAFDISSHYDSAIFNYFNRRTNHCSILNKASEIAKCSDMGKILTNKEFLWRTGANV
jgi:phosphoribosylaminoimidazolecarboxamide formyltransferase / IMP cyclohydrolase